mmetsp:Transcript_41303/g.81533  ORF Transcript_41303/g.81533 Transcript_41303/m.81533 type:complete len:105 (+) Transcript_41303:2-316(+)
MAVTKEAKKRQQGNNQRQMLILSSSVVVVHRIHVVTAEKSLAVLLGKVYMMGRPPGCQHQWQEVSELKPRLPVFHSSHSSSSSTVHKTSHTKRNQQLAPLVSWQ